jgi:hypothetical protein
MAGQVNDPIERWTAKRRVALVVSLLKGETSVAKAALLNAIRLCGATCP